MSLLKDKLLHKEPKHAIDEVLSDKGGVLKTHSVGDIPRDRECPREDETANSFEFTWW